MSERDEPQVIVRVRVNVGSWRVGQEYQTVLDARTQSLAEAGYLQILGHVQPAAAVRQPEPVPAPEPVKTPRVRRPRKVELAQLPEEGEPDGQSDDPA